MQIRKLILIFSISSSVTAFAGDTNFVSTFNTLWQSRNASNILSYVDGYLSTNQNVEALFARGVIAAGLQSWGRGATNYLYQAITNINASTNYTVEQKADLTNEIAWIREAFGGLLQDVGEPENSSPSWSTNVQAMIFGESGDEAPFLHILNNIANPE